MSWHELPGPVVDEFERAFADFLVVLAAATSRREMTLATGQSQSSAERVNAGPGPEASRFEPQGGA